MQYSCLAAPSLLMIAELLKMQGMSKEARVP